ncbi:MAG: DUF192 domain-containing protein [Candidatus Micrarchaeota archaeon]|nr:DUF192 domain-containing protein [Candidatus Micrarchaeota archaeon]
MNLKPVAVSVAIVLISYVLVMGWLAAQPATVGLSLGPANYSLRAEVASTEPARERGLMGRAQLPENAGMLFVFNQTAPQTFWMAGTLLPLEILFINDTGAVVDIQEMAPCPSSNWSSCPRYVSAAPVRYALEVNSGFASRHGLQVGQLVPAPDTS